MTLGTDQKRHMLTRWPTCYTHSFPKGVTKAIKDGMPEVKYKPDHIQTVQAYVTDHVLKPVEAYLNDPTKNISHLYMVLDRGKNMAKSIFAHAGRNRGIVPMAEPTQYPFVIPPDGFLPKQWDALLANRELTRREVYPLFYRALIDTYKPPAGKCVVLDGAPPRPVSKQEYLDNGGIDGSTFKTVSFSRVFIDPTLQMAQQGANVLATPRVAEPMHYRGPVPAGEYDHECVEGDLSAFVYVNKHFKHPGNNGPHATNDDIIMDTNDGDTLMIALLHSRDRIDPINSRFLNRVWVKLKGQESTRIAYKKRKDEALAKGKEWKEDVIDGRDIYVNINMLYIEIDRDPDLRKAQYPVLMAVSLYILSGTDFFGDFTGDEYALFFFMNWEKCVWDTWCKYAERFSHMIMMFYSGETTFNQPELLRRVYIDEPAFLNFFYQCYATKYGEAMRKEYGEGVRITPELLERYTSHFALQCKRKPNEDDKKWEARFKMARKKRVPPRAILVRYIRLLMGNVIYWVNDYRPGGHTMFDPLETYLDFPFYGFMKDPETGSITLSPICSPAKPVPAHCVPHINKHKKRTKKRREPDAGHIRRAGEGADGETPLMARTPSTVAVSALPVLPQPQPQPQMQPPPPAQQALAPLQPGVKRPLVPVMSPAERIKKKLELDKAKAERAAALAPRPVVVPQQQQQQQQASGKKQKT